MKTSIQGRLSKGNEWIFSCKPAKSIRLTYILSGFVFWSAFLGSICVSADGVIDAASMRVAQIQSAVELDLQSVQREYDLGCSAPVKENSPELSSLASIINSVYTRNSDALNSSNQFSMPGEINPDNVCNTTYQLLMAMLTHQQKIEQCSGVIQLADDANEAIQSAQVEGACVGYYAQYLPGEGNINKQRIKGLAAPLPGSTTQSQEQQIAEKFVELRSRSEECQSAKKEAQRCCETDILGCVNHSDSNDYSGITNAIVTQLSRASTSLAQSCSQLKSLAALGTGLQAAVAASCGGGRSQCDDSCSSIKTEVDALLDQCRKIPDGKGGFQDCDSVTSIGDLQTRITADISICENLKGKEQEAQKYAAVGLANQIKAQNCVDVAVADPVVLGNGTAKNPYDCSQKTNLNNPYCLAQVCSQPGASSISECTNYLKYNKTVVQANTGGSSSLGGAVSDTKPTEADSSLDTVSGGAQEFQGLDKSIAPQQNHVAEEKPGGQGNGLQGGSDSGGSPGKKNALASSGAGNSGYKTDILQGYGGGGGFVSGSSYSGGYSSGGKSSLSMQSYNKNLGKSFNLKDFLPGQKRDPRYNRQLASVGGSTLGKKYDNIFDMVKRRYRDVCANQRLSCK